MKAKRMNSLAVPTLTAVALAVGMIGDNAIGAAGIAKTRAPDAPGVVGGPDLDKAGTVLAAGGGSGNPGSDRGQASRRQGGGSKDPARDQGRARSPEQMQQHLQDMERLHERVRRADPGSAAHKRLMREYRNRIHQGMQGLDRMPRPGPDASEGERLRYLQQRDRQMEQLMRHMWTYQEERAGPGGE